MVSFVILEFGAQMNRFFKMRCWIISRSSFAQKRGNDSMERNMNALPYEAKVALVNLVTKEVFCALMIMKSYKAPGLDGYQPIFFKMF